MSANRTWRKFSGDQAQNSGLNFDLYDIFINDLVENIKGLFTKFVSDWKKKIDCKSINRIQTALDSLDW